jgi:hypothetical protein
MNGNMQCSCTQPKLITNCAPLFAGLRFLLSLPNDIKAKIKQHVSRQDWECYRAACMLPLRRNLGRQESLNLGVDGGTRQEQALWSDPLVRRLFISLSLRQADGKLHELHSLFGSPTFFWSYDTFMTVSRFVLGYSIRVLVFRRISLIWLD